jgi:hypothetical protein
VDLLAVADGTVIEARDGIASEGLPFSFASYDLLGSMPFADVDAKAWTPFGPPEKRTAEMPMHDQVVTLH